MHVSPRGRRYHGGGQNAAQRGGETAKRGAQLVIGIAYSSDLQQAKAKMASQVKVSTLIAYAGRLSLITRQVLLLGSGDSGKSTVLKV